jgi:ZIP family zinc transporter
VSGVASPGRRPRVRLWLLGLAPLALLVALLAVIVQVDPAETLRGELPPVEELTFERVRLTPGGMVVTLLNDGPDPVRVAQVMVDEAYWAFSMEPEGELRHLERTVLEIPYPWVDGEAHQVRLITSTGVTFDHEIAVAVSSPRPGWRFFAVFALIGLYVGVIPVALGLLWYPLVGRLGRPGLDFVLALTVGLLLFLLVDAGHEGLEVAGQIARSYQGVILFVFTSLAAFVAIELFAGALKTRGAKLGVAWVTALLVAVGIGLHNFGEGLAIGAAFALGEVALGNLLIVGFALHNTTEGLAIVAPLAETRVGIGRLAVLGLIAGVPTIGGAWLGGFAYAPVWSVLFLGMGAGAIAQVIVQIVGSIAGERPLAGYLRTGPVVGGLAAGFLLMYGTGMLIG